MKPEYEKLHQLRKPALRELLRNLGAVRRDDLKVFQLTHGELLARVLETLQGRGELTSEEVRNVYANAAREHDKVLIIGSGAPQDFKPFLRDAPAGPLVEIHTSQIGAVRQEEGFLKGLMYICGVLFHVEFIRVKWKEVYTADEDSADGLVKKGDRLSTTNEEGIGEQVPWDDREDSLCQQWWQSMVHVDECIFHTIEVPPFEGRYVMLIHPGGK